MNQPCITLLALTLTALAVLGCGDDGTGDSTEGMGSTGSTTAGSASSTGPTSESTTSVATSSMDSTGPATSSTTSPTSTDDSTSATSVDTDALECFGLDARSCMANPQCMPIVGTPILMPDGGACLGPREFLDCQLATGCGDAITYACAGLDAPLYQFLDTCIPEGWIDCGPPPAGEIPPC